MSGYLDGKEGKLVVTMLVVGLKVCFVGRYVAG